MDWLYGRVGFSLLDHWSVIHAAFWIVVGSIAWSLGKKTGWVWWRLAALAACLAIALGWEAFEQIMAPRHQDMWRDWFAYDGFKFNGVCSVVIPGCSFESWWNSFVSDPLTCVVGLVCSWAMLDKREPS